MVNKNKKNRYNKSKRNIKKYSNKSKRNIKKYSNKNRGGSTPYFDLDILISCHCIADENHSKLYTHYRHTTEPFDETKFNNVKYIDNWGCKPSLNQYTDWNYINQQFDVIYAIYCPLYSSERSAQRTANSVYDGVFNTNNILKPNGRFVIYAPDEESLRKVTTTFKNYLKMNRLDTNLFYFTDTPYEDYTYNMPAVYSSEQPDFVIEIMKK
jgi:hypothetical protein